MEAHKMSYEWIQLARELQMTFSLLNFLTKTQSKV